MSEHSADEAFAEAREWLVKPETLGLGLAAVEEELAARGQEIQRLLFQQYLDEQAAAEPRSDQVTDPGRDLPPTG
jgi:hypothetical protein